MKTLLIVISCVILSKPVFPLVEYAVHYDYISRVMCINKNKPAMTCNGKCHLKQQLAQQAETDKPSEKKGNVSTEEFTLICEMPADCDFSSKTAFDQRRCILAAPDLFVSLPVAVSPRPPVS